MTSSIYRPQLYVRNDGISTITFNDGNISWTLPPSPDLNFMGELPWDVAISPGFQRIWNHPTTEAAVTVALDPDINDVITALPGTGGNDGTYRPFPFTQAEPQASTTVTHGFNRNGPVSAVVTSLDGYTEYVFVDVSAIDANSCTISFDDPTAFLATIY